MAGDKHRSHPTVADCHGAAFRAWGVLMPICILVLRSNSVDVGLMTRTLVASTMVPVPTINPLPAGCSCTASNSAAPSSCRLVRHDAGGQAIRQPPSHTRQAGAVSRLRLGVARLPCLQRAGADTPGSHHRPKRNVIGWFGRASLFTCPRHTGKQRALTESVMYMTDNIPSTCLQSTPVGGWRQLSRGQELTPGAAGHNATAPATLKLGHGRTPGHCGFRWWCCAAATHRGGPASPLRGVGIRWLAHRLPPERAAVSSGPCWWASRGICSRRRPNRGRAHRRGAAGPSYVPGTFRHPTEPRAEGPQLASRRRPPVRLRRRSL